MARMRARSPLLWLLVGALGFAGCSDTPQVPAPPARAPARGANEPRAAIAWEAKSEADERAIGDEVFDALRAGRRAASLDEFERGGWQPAHEADLNWDGIDDAFLTNDRWCGTGGCDTWVIQSDRGGFVPVMHAFADECWDSRDAVPGHFSIDCLARVYTPSGAADVVARWRWAARLGDGESTMRYAGGLPTPDDEENPPCERAKATRATKVYLLPRAEVRLVRAPRSDELAVDSVRDLTDAVRGRLGVVWFEPAEDEAQTEWRWAERAKEVAAPEPLVRAELDEGASFATSARVRDDTGAFWISRDDEELHAHDGWVRAADTDCAAQR
jgi:hypothetical protein